MDSPRYTSLTFIQDTVAALTVTVLLVPQSLAYALLAGLPPETGLYASIVPLVAYAVFGSSKTLSVGPVAVASLMTAAAVGDIVASGLADATTAAITLALLGGVMLMLLGCLRMGFIANFLSHSVISGFISASGILIACSQLKHLLGISMHGDSLPELLSTLGSQIAVVHMPTVLLGGSVLVFLGFCRSGLAPLLATFGIPKPAASVMTKAAPMLAVIATIFLSQKLDLASSGIAIIGEVPSGLPSFSVSIPSIELIEALIAPAFIIAMVGFVESVSVGRTLGAKRRERIIEDRELLGLGAANIASAASGGFPVTGGFSRSVVNFDAGARTQVASGLTALGMGAVIVYLTPYLYYLPRATLAATIIIAVGSLISFRDVGTARALSRSDFSTIVTTLCMTLLFGVEVGVVVGIVCSVGLHLYKTSVPHVAEVGLVAGTEHYRNVRRHDVITYPGILSLRIDESLYFANAGYLETYVENIVDASDGVKHVILMCSAVNEIDITALHSLGNINLALQSRGSRLHLSEVKGPVMDKLSNTNFIETLTGNVFLSHHQAITELRAAKTA